MQRTRRTGGSAGYPPAENTYMLHKDNAMAAAQQASGNPTPALKGGAGCTSCSGGGQRRRRGGAPVELTAFISALALLGARLLADKNSSFNLFADNRQEQSSYREQLGGRPATRRCRK